LKLKAIAGIVLIFLLITVTFTLLSTGILSLVRSGYVQVFQSGSTKVGGPIAVNTTWTLAGSPYIVEKDVNVLTTANLTIEPGVVVEFADGTNLIISGGLFARGNLTHNITFTSNSTTPAPGAWGSVWSSGNVFVMDYVAIKYAEKGVKLIVPTNISNSVISNCAMGVEGKLSYANNLTVTDNTGDGLSLSSPLRIKNSNVSSNGGHGITNTDTIDMDNCVISNNTDGVILSNGGQIKNSRITSNRGNGTRILGPALITNTTIFGNGVSGNGGDGIWTGSSMSVTECYINGNNGSGIKSNYVEGAITVERSTISDNAGDGIWAGSGMSITGCNITENTGNGVSGHLLVEEFSLSILNCNISGNGQDGVTTPRNSTSEYINMHIDESIITYNNMSGLSGHGYVLNSTVSGNKMCGILGNFTIEYYNVITWNQGGGFNGTGKIFWSSIVNNSPYDAIADILPNNITATRNWWGIDDGAVIRQHIWDHENDSRLGYVFYDPWLPGPPPPIDPYPPTIGILMYKGTSPYPYLNRTGLPDGVALDFPIRMNEPVRVCVNVTDNILPKPSGVDKVLLFYRVNYSEWWNTTMTSITMYNETSGNWAVIIPAQPANSTVEFFIQAYDKAGNWNMSSTYSYTVKWLTLGDINGDGKTDMKDIYVVARNFGKKDP